MEDQEKLRKSLIRKFHVMLRNARIDETGKRMMLSAYGVEHTNELGVRDLEEICGKLDGLMKPTLDKWRKRVMASIGGYINLVKAQGGQEVIEAIACRASGYKRFNAIPESRLRNVYYEFLRKQEDTKRARGLYIGSLFSQNINLN